MSNIWSNVGADLSPRGEEWLYRLGTEIRGPVPKQAIVDKLTRGELSVKTMVAHEGGEFHPIAEVAAFEPHLEDVKRALKKRAASRSRRAVLLVLLFIGAAGGVGGWYMKQQMDVHDASEAKREAELRKQEAARLKEAENIIKSTKTELVALVSLGDISEMKVGSDSKKAGAIAAKRPTGSASGGEPEMVQSCGRSQQEIFGTLGRHLAKINVCVQDEKTRDTQKLLPSSLTLEFVVVPDGKVVDFEIDDRHYRTGPLKNCMVKAFRMIKFDTAGGTNCPVSIPIKIGG